MIQLEKSVSLGWLDQHLESVGIFCCLGKLRLRCAKCGFVCSLNSKISVSSSTFLYADTYFTDPLGVVKRGALGEFL